MPKKVIVAMSGGLDSSVAAAILKRAGFEVTGVFMKLANLLSFKEAGKRARKIAKILGIPFLVLDLRKEFKKRIIDYFLKEYKRGVTPNPCVICNKEIKFGLLLEKTLDLDADFVATGHYTRLKKDKNGIHLLKARDKDKDQSYFLWMLNQNQLKRILFPIENYTRKEVENLARKFKLPVLNIKKSVEICFIQTTINDFLKKYLKPKPGQIVDVRGKVLGKHRGLHFYTIGQRKGIGLPRGPYYVMDKDIKKSLLIVTKNEKDLYKKELTAKSINWISGKPPLLPLRIKTKIRYRQLALPATIYHLKSNIYRGPDFCRGGRGVGCSLIFEKPQRAITPGQSVVFYKGDELIGGGIIRSIQNEVLATRLEQSSRKG
ncbi:MAG: tRNA 2-thiouridine(34) synthase MnmA [Candidatus Nealsonbacteria bacterium CG_4_9_14_0_2_um_filter_37_38]|uniref:tRNA-specific 2-thiouridylase MnmA n=1 Tax=Candidatus Nealsonbacteria bacterium CG_4_10_14_0_8_um_filter_37_14 TaxID=1974684 RepID=A0A2M7R698_9BACT|nr:MAG: tRNA 2-thiouridine(34) synthase MnmA [Candidatus Nealsonbacteria bacterium CG11_big_fil_rev_8_21_14_0_20_37_68]PIY89092.1 MAG: tRNA 2-thiouridine(34) synthase MnmA [Candidatus Nealsonbacteria bacterium CG_4_10_14_0_8_um_filter_37_14]PJC51840.1 MAG: tRNA 2-thiouridine(34) synthase MnmA [Candidatus Nealsonbacteria bacterium CG_4_9_14_0_2_um_filter_37_38]